MKKILNLENLVLLTIFFLPIYLVKIKIGFFSTNVLEGLMFVSCVIYFWKNGIGKDKEKGLFPREKGLIVSLVLIFGGLILASFLAQSPIVSWGIIKGWFLFPLVFSWVARQSLGEEKFERVWRVYFFSSLAVAIVSFFGYFFEINFITYDNRLQGFFNSPNYLAMYLLPGFLAGLFQLKFFNLKKEFFQKNIQMLVFLGIILVAIYLTQSYTAWMALFLIFLAMVFVFLKNKKRIIFISGLLLVASLIFLLEKSTDKAGQLFTLNERSSLASRIMIWHSAEKILEDNWLFGIGPGNFQKKYLEYQKYFPPYLEWAVSHPHNIFLTFWLSGGLPALAGFFGILFFWFLKLKKNNVQLNKNGTFYFFVMLVILLHGLLDSTYFKNDLAVVFWLVFWGGFMLKTDSIKQSIPTVDKKKHTFISIEK